MSTGLVDAISGRGEAPRVAASSPGQPDRPVPAVVLSATAQTTKCGKLHGDTPEWTWRFPQLAGGEGFEDIAVNSARPSVVEVPPVDIFPSPIALGTC